jgi:hypothetical protein
VALCLEQTGETDFKEIHLVLVIFTESVAVVVALVIQVEWDKHKLVVQVVVVA